MAAYLLAQLKFTHLETYRRYEAKFPAIFAKCGGRVLVADEAPSLLDGVWGLDKVVLLAFEDELAAQRFHDDPEYLEIAKERDAGAEVSVLLLRGVGPRSG